MQRNLEAVVEVDSVHKSFGRTAALAGLSLRVAPGEVAALLGPNGAGKTTLIRILATLLRPDAGRVLVAGTSVTDHPVAVRRMIGLAGQYAAIDETLTGRENLVMVARLYRLPAPDARRAAEAVLERLSLTTAADRAVRTYSGGMRRRLDVGASLVGRPKLLLLDEPSTGLDPAARFELWSLLKELVSDGTTMLLTTQQLEEADRLASCVTIINRGTVVSEGRPAELKRQLGYETIDVVIADRLLLGRAAHLLRPLATAAPDIDETAGRLTFKAQLDTKALPHSVRLLDEAGITLEDATVQRPSLDDVFMHLTAQPSGRHPSTRTRPT